MDVGPGGVAPATPLTGAPPLAPLRAVLDRLERAGIEAALGGSALLMALGLARGARDWDLTTEAAVETLDALFADVPHERHGASGVHADHKLTFDGGAVELIARFAFRHEAGVCRIPTIVTARWHGMPVGSPEAWAAAYALMGRHAKAELLFDHLAGGGADRERVARLLAEPLPGALRARLEALLG